MVCTTAARHAATVCVIHTTQCSSPFSSLRTRTTRGPSVPSPTPTASPPHAPFPPTPRRWRFYAAPPLCAPRAALVPDTEPTLIVAPLPIPRGFERRPAMQQCTTSAASSLIAGQSVDSLPNFDAFPTYLLSLSPPPSTVFELLQ
ncbi:hypothetical protein B0H19DRAFT_1265362 [Mycena capillaripes]|nr:hypothetical protein B0H19DRAFT_1265362 [Mycena capillaripes]